MFGYKVITIVILLSQVCLLIVNAQQEVDGIRVQPLVTLLKSSADRAKANTPIVVNKDSKIYQRYMQQRFARKVDQNLNNPDAEVNVNDDVNADVPDDNRLPKFLSLVEDLDDEVNQNLKSSTREERLIGNTNHNTVSLSHGQPGPSLEEQLVQVEQTLFESSSATPQPAESSTYSTKLDDDDDDVSDEPQIFIQADDVDGFNGKLISGYVMLPSEDSDSSSKPFEAKPESPKVTTYPIKFPSDVPYYNIPESTSIRPQFSVPEQPAKQPLYGPQGPPGLSNRPVVQPLQRPTNFAGYPQHQVEQSTVNPLLYGFQLLTGAKKQNTPDQQPAAIGIQNPFQNFDPQTLMNSLKFRFSNFFN